MKGSIAAACILAVLAAPGCASDIAPYPGASAVLPMTETERRAWGQGEDIDEALRKSGRLLEDEKVTGYVQGVMDRLFPEFKGRIHVHIVRSPHLNAFALPNGSVYINEGLLARFQNEAQLATVLAHEGIHFVNRHGMQSMQTAKSSSALGTLVSVIGIPAGVLVGNLLMVSSITGFSQELETEADNLGYERVVAAGYDPRETPKTFEFLMAERKASDIEEPFFFSSHPRLQERYDNFKRLSADAAPPPPASRPDPYLAMMAPLRVSNIENDLSMGRFEQVLLVLGNPDQAKNYPAYSDFYRGEAYRLRGKKGDDALALEAYLRAAEEAPDFSRTYRALGMHYLKTGDYAAAQKYFEKYIAMTEDPAARRYAESYIAIARERGAKP